MLSAMLAMCTYRPFPLWKRFTLLNDGDFHLLLCNDCARLLLIQTQDCSLQPSMGVLPTRSRIFRATLFPTCPTASSPQPPPTLGFRS